MVELADGFSGDASGLREKLKAEIRQRLLVTADVQLVPHGTVPRETYKSKLIDYSDAGNVEAASA